MKKVIFIFFILVNSSAAIVSAQAPDLSKLTTDDAKVKAWINYCKELRLNKSGAADNYIVLQQAGLKGLQLVKANDDSDKASFYLYTALGNYYQIKFDSAQYYFYQSLNSAQHGHATKLIAGACEALMSLNFQLQQLGKVDTCKNILQTIADTTKDKLILRDIYAAFGSYYQQKSFYTTAQDYYIKSIRLRTQDVDTTRNDKTKFDYAIQCDQLSKLYLNTQMADKSLASLRNGKRFADVSPVVSNRLLSSFIEAFTTSGNIDSALFYNGQLIANTKGQRGFPSELVTSNLNIAIYYIDHKQYDKALTYLTKGDSLAALIKQPFLIFQAQMIKGRFLEETAKYDESLLLLKEALPVGQQLDKDLYSNILQYMALAYKGKGDLKMSLDYYERYVGAADTLNKEKISRTFADLETHYQTNEKENRIVSLNNQNRLNVLELQNATRTRLFLIIGLIGLGIISLLLYFIYRNREKVNKILNDRNHQLDVLNNELSIANDTKAKLFGVISHDLRAPVSSIVQLLHLQKEIPEQLSEEVRKQYESRLNKASGNVLETMEDLLLWSKSQMNSFTPQHSSVKIAPLLQQEIALVEEQANEKSLIVNVDVNPAISQYTDENFLGVIMRNLLQNAIGQCDCKDVITVSADEKNIFITNPVINNTAGNLNAIMQQANVNSKRSGLGMQIIKDLAVKLGITIMYEQNYPNTVTAKVSWV